MTTFTALGSVTLNHHLLEPADHKVALPLYGNLTMCLGILQKFQHLLCPSQQLRAVIVLPISQMGKQRSTEVRYPSHSLLGSVVGLSHISSVPDHVASNASWG